MQILEILPGTLRFADGVPESLPPGGFVWVHVARSDWEAQFATLQLFARRLGGSELLDLHAQDLASAAHPSHYDYTSVYDLIVFRRLATAAEALRADGATCGTQLRDISTHAVGFAVFDRLLISVHPDGCTTARSLIERMVAEAKFSVGTEPEASARSRTPTSPNDLALRMINAMVDSYLELRKELTAQLELWQTQLLKPSGSFQGWKSIMSARARLHTVEDLCEEQHDAMQEWLDCLREQPAALPSGAVSQAERDQIIARARDIIEHIQRVVHHVRRLEQAAETVVQIHFSAQSNRTNDIMRTLTALTAIFLPLNLIAGIFGMNFEHLPLIHAKDGFLWAIGGMLTIASSLGLLFWRKRYLARTRS